MIFRNAHIHPFKAENRLKSPLIREIESENLLLSEYELEPDSTVNIVLDKNKTIYIIPIFGGVDVFLNEVSIFVHIKKILLFNNMDNCILKNSFEASVVNFLVIQVQKESLENSPSLLNFHLKENELIAIKNNLSIGVFLGKVEERFLNKYKVDTVFCYTVTGVFEIENRLLSAKEAITFKDFRKVNFESLASFSMLIFVCK